MNGLISTRNTFSTQIIEVILEVGVEWGRGWYDFHVVEILIHVVHTCITKFIDNSLSPPPSLSFSLTLHSLIVGYCVSEVGASFASFRYGLKEHLNDWVRYMYIINKVVRFLYINQNFDAIDRRELTTIPLQPTRSYRQYPIYVIFEI